MKDEDDKSYTWTNGASVPFVWTNRDSFRVYTFQNVLKLGYRFSEPNWNVENGDCMTMRYPTFDWSSVDCNAPLPFICETVNSGKGMDYEII